MKKNRLKLMSQNLSPLTLWWIGWLFLWGFLAWIKPEWSILFSGKQELIGTDRHFSCATISSLLMALSIFLSLKRVKMPEVEPALMSNAGFQIFWFYGRDLLRVSETPDLTSPFISEWLNQRLADPIYFVLGLAFFLFLLVNMRIPIVSHCHRLEASDPIDQNQEH